MLYVNRYEYLDVEDSTIPSDFFALHGNFPNPFNPTTQIRFDLPNKNDVKINIYNMLGQKLKYFLFQIHLPETIRLHGMLRIRVVHIERWSLSISNDIRRLRSNA